MPKSQQRFAPYHSICLLHIRLNWGNIDIALIFRILQKLFRKICTPQSRLAKAKHPVKININNRGYLSKTSQLEKWRSMKKQ